MKVVWFCTVSFFTLYCFSSSHANKGFLLDGIRHYEELNYDTSHINARHEKLKRSMVSKLKSHERVIPLVFDAFNHTFSIELWPSQDVFAPGAQFLVHTNEGIIPSQYQPTSFYRGKLLGQPLSKVHGHIQNGVFDGEITTDTHEQYHVEYAHKYFLPVDGVHSIIYSTKDIIYDSKKATCALKESMLNKLQAIQATAKRIYKPRKPISDKEYSQILSNRLKRNEHSIHKRAETVSGGLYCQIFIAVDHLFLSNIAGNSESAAISEVTAVFASTQTIFRTTDFNSDGSPDLITPQLVRTEVLNSNSYNGLFQPSSITVDDFLDRWSRIDHSDYCLSLLLTYRDFNDGVLGLAWVAQPPGGSSGGICEGRVTLPVGERSLNTAIVSYLNYGSRQPRGVVTITVAHEFGHNFGSSHDPENVQCSPGGSNGNYIMYPRATDGTQNNNNLFSPCSINSIYSVLKTKSQCFRNNGSFCGNQIREDPEVCDCGNADTCNNVDSCCEPTQCVLKPTSFCSATDGCCINCNIADSGHICSQETECAYLSVCDGNSSSCPVPLSKTTPCMNGTRFCQKGECTGSVCLTKGWTECQCKTTIEHCHVCCSVNGTCISTFTLNSDGFLEVGGQYRESGRSCNSFQGYCSDADPPVCIGVDNEATLNDLLNIFTLDTLNTVIAWLREYWWIPIIVIVVIIIIIVLLHLTYRKRKPIKKAARRASNSVRRRSGSSVEPQNSSSNNARTTIATRENQETNRQQETREILQRLKKFFPTCDTEILVQTYRSQHNDQKTVKKLSSLGFPMKKVPIPRI